MRSGNDVRYVYLKNGDAVEQTRRILTAGQHEGPDACLGAFLAAHRSDEVLVLCRARPAGRFRAGRITVQSCPGPMAAGRWAGRIVAALRLGARILIWRPDRILSSCDREALWVSVCVAGLLRVPIVASRHTGLPERCGMRRLSRLLETFFLRRCDSVICHGPFLVDSAREAGVASGRISSFGVDLRAFGAAAASTTPPPPAPLAAFAARFPFIVMYVGRMQENKGIFDLLPACIRLGQRGGQRPGLVYVGGEHIERLREQVTSLGLDDRVLILGEVPHHHLAAVMRCATVIATPTQPPVQEGRCKVVLEAFVAGVPVVSPGFAAFPYVVAHEDNGLLFTPGSSDALADAIARIACDAGLLAQLRRGAAATGERLLQDPEPDFVSAVTTAFSRADAATHRRIMP